MIKVDRSTINKLREVGLLQERTKLNPPNYVVTNRTHKSRAKTYNLVEDPENPEVMYFLGRWFKEDVEKKKLVTITQVQLDELKKIHRNLKIQKNGEYIPKADVYQWNDGQETVIYARNTYYFQKNLRQINSNVK